MDKLLVTVEPQEVALRIKRVNDVLFALDATKNIQLIKVAIETLNDLSIFFEEAVMSQA